MNALAFPRADASPDGGSTPLLLDGPAGPIEAIVEYAEAPRRPLVAILCHPLPTEGGTMHNKVVTMAARALRESGADTVRFNFRGVGASAGTFDEGRGEAEDLRAVAAWVRATRPDAQLWLAGFSFGAFVSLKCARTLSPGMLVSIAPPAGRGWGLEQAEPPECPWLVVQGDADEVVEPAEVYAWLDTLGATMRQPPALVRMPETSHFFHRRLIDLRGVIKNGVKPYLPAPIG